MSEEAEAGWGLVLSFSGLYQTMPEEHAFVHGVEFGQLWHRMSSGAEAEIETATHTENRTVIERAAAAKGWHAEIKPSDVPGWDLTVLRKVRAERINPHGLKVVQ